MGWARRASCNRMHVQLTKWLGWDQVPALGGVPCSLGKCPARRNETKQYALAPVWTASREIDPRLMVSANLTSWTGAQGWVHKLPIDGPDILCVQEHRKWLGRLSDASRQLAGLGWITMRSAACARDWQPWASYGWSCYCYALSFGREERGQGTGSSC